MNRDFKGVWIPKEVWLDKNLTIIEKTFLAEIDSLDNEGGCYASNKYFSDFFGITRGRSTQIIKSLEKKGKVTIKLVKAEKIIEKRIIRMVNKLTRVVNKLNRDSKYSNGVWLENAQENNTKSSNTKSSNTRGHKITIPENFKLDDELIKYAKTKGVTSLKTLNGFTEDFILSCKQHGYEYKDFHCTWKKWFRDAIDKGKIQKDPIRSEGDY